MFIEVMYADKIGGKFRRARARLTNMDSLDKTGVLFIILSEVDPATSENRRVSEVWEHANSPTRWHADGGDYYAVIQKPGFVMLTGWTEQQWTWIPTGGDLWDGTRRSSHSKPPDFGDKTQVTIFKGKLVSAADWEVAKNEFQAGMK